MSVIVFAGASQLAVFQLMSAQSPWLIMVLTAWVINLRFSMYSAALAPHLQHLPAWKKAPLAYMLSDQAFGISLSRFAVQEPKSPHWFYFGAALAVWTTWQLSATAGALLGSQIDPRWGFDFAFPLSFMALLFGALRNKPTVLAALTGGLTAVAAKSLPYNLGLPLAISAGIAAGLWAESLLRRKEAQ
jgi:predicted branched-subunit amino acid permease